MQLEIELQHLAHPVGIAFIFLEARKGGEEEGGREGRKEETGAD